jgi:hypothetical protein
MALKQIEIFIVDFFNGCFFVYEKIHGKFPIEIDIFLSFLLHYGVMMKNCNFKV